MIPNAHPLEKTVERTILILAGRDTVFRYFTDSERFAAWWGAGSTIEGRVGGRMRIRYPNGETASGEVLEIVPDTFIAFSYGYDWRSSRRSSRRSSTRASPGFSTGTSRRGTPGARRTAVRCSRHP